MSSLTHWSDLNSILGLRGRQLVAFVTSLSEDVPSVQRQSVLFSGINNKIALCTRPVSTRKHVAVAGAISNSFGPQAATFYFVFGLESCADIVRASSTQSVWLSCRKFDHDYDQIFIENHPFFEIFSRTCQKRGGLRNLAPFWSRWPKIFENVMFENLDQISQTSPVLKLLDQNVKRGAVWEIWPRFLKPLLFGKGAVWEIPNNLMRRFCLG